MLLLVVVFIAAAIAGLAAIVSGRAVSETRHQKVLEHETRAFNSAFAQIHLAMNVVNSSGYDEQNHNLVLRAAMDGDNGGTASATGGSLTGGGAGYVVDKNGTFTRLADDVAGQTSGYTKDPSLATSTSEQRDLSSANTAWLDDPSDPVYGLVAGTNVRVYRGRDYIKRLQRLKGETITEVDPYGDSDSYFVLEAAGRAGSTVRLVSALVRENQPFSSFVFFQNNATLGVSGSPRGLIHTNDTLAFYFPDGRYMDTVSAVNGFEYLAGANPQNTSLRDANPAAARIDLQKVDFNELKGKADLYVGDPGLDAEIKLFSNGKVRIRPHTPPRYEQVEKSYSYRKYVGKKKVTTTVQKKVKVGTQKVAYDAQVVDYYKTETYVVQEKVQVGTKTKTWTETKKVQVGTKTETRYKDVQVQTGTKKVKHTSQKPVYKTRTVTKYKQVKVWKAYDTGGAGGGTTVAGGASGGLGEWVWESQPYQATETYIDHYETVVTWTDESVYKTVQQAYTVTVPVYENQTVTKSKQVPVYEWQDVTKTRQVPVYKTVTKYKDEPIYEMQDVQVTKKVKVYETVTVTYKTWEYQKPTYFNNQFFKLGPDKSGTVYVDGRITKLAGDLLGRLTIVGNESIRVTGNLRYVDKSGKTAMENGLVDTKPYARNSEYAGHSVLGIIARDDIRFTRTMPSNAEINATLMAVNGRVGIDGFWADSTGELRPDSWRTRYDLLGLEGYLKEYAYDRIGKYKTKKFLANSLRRIGGIISNNRIMETYVSQDKDGHAIVTAGFKRGDARFDINLLFNPPPNFVEVPRPVVTAFVPVLLVRNDDS